MSTMDYDFRDQEPVWVRYAEWVGQGHDKYYEVRVDLSDEGLFILTKRWGARPDRGSGQTKVETYQTMPSATTAALSMFASKLSKGYREVERPMGADNKVAKEHGADYYAEDSEAF